MSSSDNKVAIYGASGHGNAVATMLRRQNSQCVVAFIDDTPEKIGGFLSEIPILSFPQWRSLHLHVPCFLSSGNPGTRRALAERVRSVGGQFPVGMTGSAFSLNGNEIDIGSAVWEPIFVGPNVKIGKHVQVMPMSSVGHDVFIGDFATICPGCTVSGHVIIEDGAFIGAGSVIINGTRNRPIVIGRGAVIGAASFVSKNIKAGDKVSGNPAMPMREMANLRRLGRKT